MDQRLIYRPEGGQVKKFTIFDGLGFCAPFRYRTIGMHAFYIEGLSGGRCFKEGAIQEQMGVISGGIGWGFFFGEFFKGVVGAGEGEFKVGDDVLVAQGFDHAAPVQDSELGRFYAHENQFALL
jgi:hypothetical protein